MRDAASTSDPPALQRARGAVRIAAKRRGDLTVLDRLYQSGSAKVLLPKADGFEAVLINTAGGLAGGDVFDLEVEAGPGAAVTVTTQAAERVYRSTGAEAVIEARARIGAGARLDWLPRETILFDRGRLRRGLSVEMESDATLLVCEALVFGRAAMGESVVTGALRDTLRVTRGGRLAFADTLRLGEDIADALRAPAGFGGARACASALYVAPDAEDRLGAVRRVLDELIHSYGLDAGASAWNDLLRLRILAPDGAALCRALPPVIAALRAAPPPRVWRL